MAAYAPTSDPQIRKQRERRLSRRQAVLARLQEADGRPAPAPGRRVVADPARTQEQRDALERARAQASTGGTQAPAPDLDRLAQLRAQQLGGERGLKQQPQRAYVPGREREGALRVNKVEGNPRFGEVFREIVGEGGVKLHRYNDGTISAGQKIEPQLRALAEQSVNYAKDSTGAKPAYRPGRQQPREQKAAYLPGRTADRQQITRREPLERLDDDQAQLRRLAELADAVRERRPKASGVPLADLLADRGVVEYGTRDPRRSDRRAEAIARQQRNAARERAGDVDGASDVGRRKSHVPAVRPRRRYVPRKNQRA